MDNRSTDITGDTWVGPAILHLDLDAFFAAVAQLDNPELRGKPVIVGGDPSKRGVVSTCSYEARAYGVHSAMPSVRAKELCPDAIWVRPAFDRYRELSGQVFEILRQHSGCVERTSIDEGYADLTPTRTECTDPVERARAILDAIDELGLSASAGLSTSRSVSKIASDYKKPRGLTVVRPGAEANFLAPLPVSRMPGIGPVLQAALARARINTLGELAQVDPQDAATWWGSRAPEYVTRAGGVDPRGVRQREPAKSISAERTFSQDIPAGPELDSALRALAERVTWRARTEGHAGRTITVKLHFDWTDRHTASKSLPYATDRAADVGRIAVELARGLCNAGTGVRLAGVKLSSFDDAPEQLALFDTATGEEPSERPDISPALDAVREKFGYGAIVSGATLKRQTPERDEAADSTEG